MRRFLRQSRLLEIWIRLLLIISLTSILLMEMATMFVVAAGFRRTSLVSKMVNGITKLTRGSFRTAYLGYILIAVILTNFIASPMVVYAIVSPLLCANTSQTLYNSHLIQHLVPSSQ